MPHARAPGMRRSSVPHAAAQPRRPNLQKNKEKCSAIFPETKAKSASFPACLGSGGKKEFPIRSDNIS